MSRNKVAFKQRLFQLDGRETSLNMKAEEFVYFSLLHYRFSQMDQGPTFSMILLLTLESKLRRREYASVILISCKTGFKMTISKITTKGSHRTRQRGEE